MSGVTFVFDDGPIRRHLAKLALLHASRFDEARRNIGEYLLGEVQDRLDGQRLVDGSPMPQSKAALTGRGRAGREVKRGSNKGKVVRKGKPGKTLIDTHRLYDSYTYQLTRDGIELGSALEYAAIHHFGGETGRMGHRFTMPARPVLGANDVDERRVGDFLLAAIRGTQ